jgi:hypothetical protein
VVCRPRRSGFGHTDEVETLVDGTAFEVGGQSVHRSRVSQPAGWPQGFDGTIRIAAVFVSDSSQCSRPGPRPVGALSDQTRAGFPALGLELCFCLINPPLCLGPESGE